MFDHLDESTRVLDVRGVFLAASAYAAAGALLAVVPPGPGPRNVLVLTVWSVAAGAFALRQGRRWVRPAAVHSALAAFGGSAWLYSERWIAERIDPLLHPDRVRMAFSIVENGCYGPSAMDVLITSAALWAAAGLGSVPVGWAARRLFPVQQEGRWPELGGWRARASFWRRVGGRTR